MRYSTKNLIYYKMCFYNIQFIHSHMWIMNRWEVLFWSSTGSHQVPILSVKNRNVKLELTQADQRTIKHGAASNALKDSPHVCAANKSAALRNANIWIRAKVSVGTVPLLQFTYAKVYLIKWTSVLKEKWKWWQLNMEWRGCVGWTIPTLLLSTAQGESE